MTVTKIDLFQLIRIFEAFKMINIRAIRFRILLKNILKF